MINHTAGKPSRPIDIGIVDFESKRGLRKCGSGRITIDSAAGESVCPVDMVPGEPIHKTDKDGTRYRAAGGQALFSRGEKRVKFKAGTKIGSINFQAIDEIKKPLASAAKIANKGNLIVLDSEGCDSYILN